MTALSIRCCGTALLLTMFACGGTALPDTLDGSTLPGGDAAACIAQACSYAAPFWNEATCSCDTVYPGSQCSTPEACPVNYTWNVATCNCEPNGGRTDASVPPKPDGGTILHPDSGAFPPPPDSGPPPPEVCPLASGGDCPVGASCDMGPCTSGTAAGTLSCSCSLAADQTPTLGACICSADGAVSSVCGGLECPSGTVLDPVACTCTQQQTNPTSCNIPGFGACALDSYCDYGICPDGKTPYGCYCQSNGIANCSNNCPTPVEDASVACYIPNYGYCQPQTECVIGMCPDGVTPVNCFCMADGTTQCTSQCPPFDGGVSVDAGRPVDAALPVDATSG